MFDATGRRTAATARRLVYPQRREAPPESALDRGAVSGLGRMRNAVAGGPDRAFVRRVLAQEREVGALPAQTLRADLRATSHRLRRNAPRSRAAHAALVRAFALIREVAGRELGMRHFPVQLLGGKILHDGALAEMDTGEGKTLVATLAAGAAALAGEPVHVITANEYLAKRDADWMGPVYRGLGLSVGCVLRGMAPEARRAAYRSDVVYCSNKDVAFDHLRDRTAMAGQSGNLRLKVEAFGRTGDADDGFLLPGLHFAIVDEADSVLIDEARTPLILSATPDRAAEEAAIAAVMELAGDLAEGPDFRIDRRRRQITLGDGALTRLHGRAEALPAAWRARPVREDLTRTALSALHLHREGEHYILRDGKVEIVDEYTGRAMPDRSWSTGLHQAVEIKEGCAVTPRRETVAQITYQRFFLRYRRLAGMTGTAREAAGELWSTYRLRVVRVPTNRPSLRRHLPARVFRTAAAKWAAIAARAEEMARAGRAVLIGTRTVAASEAASAALGQAGVAHRVLSAVHHADEADVVANAGQPGMVTIATNMAGRGTDIRLAPSVVAGGGLYVVVSERHTARRIDRQLAGRCGRQGDPGTVETFLSFEDELVQDLSRQALPDPALSLARLGGIASRRPFDRAQCRAERDHARARRRLLKLDEQIADTLAFTGPPE